MWQCTGRVKGGIRSSFRVTAQQAPQSQLILLVFGGWLGLGAIYQQKNQRSEKSHFGAALRHQTLRPLQVAPKIWAI